MTPDYEIVESTVAHLAEMRRHMRENDRLELTCLGVSVKKALLDSYRSSIFRRTALVGGKVAAMWGVGGNYLAGKGTPWLLTTSEIEKRPIAFLKEGRREVRKMLMMFPHLENYVLASYERAVGLLVMFGFTMHEPEPYGPQGALFRRFEMGA